MNRFLEPDLSGQPHRARIAVVGSGISGASAAWALNPVHDVTLFEAGDRPGGHTCTVTVDYDGTTIPVDVGFIVFNGRNYPNLTALFELLEIATEETDMSYAMSLDGGKREWSASSYSAIFAQKRNIVSPSFLWMLKEILRFNKHSRKDKASGYMGTLTIGDYLRKRRFSNRFCDDYLIPMAAAIWSTPEIDMLDFPARSFVQFFENHRLLEVVPPRWQTVSGGAKTYLDRLLEPLGDRLRLSTPVAQIRRLGPFAGVEITDASGNTEHFDQVVIAAHSDEALAMLADPTEREKTILADIGYKPNRVVLHRDARFMPKRRKAWAAWNSLRSTGAGGREEISLTYWMNRLQNIDDDYPLFVTLNPGFEPDPKLTFGQWTFSHPQYDAAAFLAQDRLCAIQGLNNTWFAGAWTGYGFHEDGLKSGLAAAEALGAPIPWRSAGTPDLPVNENTPLIAAE